MALSKKDDRDFIVYWRKNVEKILLRISKEFGFYKELKKALNPDNKQKHNYEISRLYYDVMSDIVSNKHAVFDISELECKKKMYPIRCAMTSQLYLSHVVGLAVLQRCKLSHEMLKMCYNEFTKRLFRRKWLKSYVVEKSNWLKLFFY